MALPSQIKDGEGSGLKAGVTPDHALKVTVVPYSARFFSREDLVGLARFKLLRKYLTDSNGSYDINVDASVTTKYFKYRPTATEVAYVTGLRFILEGTELELDTNDAKRFGLATAGSTPLTVGVSCAVVQGAIQTYIFPEPVKVMGDFLAWIDDFTSLRNIISSQSDFLSFDIVFDTPIVLAGALSDELVVSIGDDLTAIDKFRAVTRGYFEEVVGM